MFNKTAMISLKTGKQWYTISRGRTIKRELSSTSVSLFSFANKLYFERQIKREKNLTLSLPVNIIVAYEDG